VTCLGWVVEGWLAAGIGGIGELLTGIGAVYAAVFGLRSYQQSVEAAAITTLIELEREFRSVFQTFAAIEDEEVYRSEIARTLNAEASNAKLEPEDRRRIGELDLCLRFFYLLWVRSKLSRSARILPQVYSYYMELILQKPELAQYAQKYYPVIFQLLRVMSSSESATVE
jgi:hypothetical protein